jgi:FkbH-like protein
VKAVAVDLDGTLYQGVLAEDGPQAVQLTAGHADLQRHLVELQRSGMLLALVTRNERSDVDALFAARGDFPLQLAHCSAIEACRDDKAAALGRIAARLHIGADAIVFLDDNAGELAAVAERLQCFTVHASHDARHTARVLAHVAGIFRWRASREDGLRVRDVAAMEERDAQADVTGSDTAQYLQSLRVRLDYYVGHVDHLPRAAELARKTNQFNVSLRRTPEAEIAKRLSEAPTNVITVALADRLSDSGVVAAIVGRRVDDVLELDEVCVSCRALGRRMEDAMLSHALRLMGGAQPPTRVWVAIADGPRNGPAREWLRRHADDDVPFDGGRVAIAFERMVARPTPGAVHVEVHE